MFGQDRVKLVKIGLVIAAIIIAAGSLTVSQSLISDLKKEERGKMAVWAEAMSSLIRADETTDLNLVLKVINGNNTIPIILLDEEGNVMEHRNIDTGNSPDSLQLLKNEALRMKRAGHVMYLSMNDDANATDDDTATQSNNDRFAVCYGESVMLRRLAAFPYIQLGVVGLFIAVAIYALLSSKRAEQNKVWVGLSRETAHQLGTPISSLMAWTEVLKETYPDEPVMKDLNCDVERLQLIAERFSKIGSAPNLQPEDLSQTIAQALEYIGRRASDKVQISTYFPQHPILAKVNPPLFAWVIENLCKNAIDAMSGIGRISVTLTATEKTATIEVADTGKGIPKSRFKTVFRPGFTTKQRGWGLGLSLAKRIIEQYHGGSIFVKSSEPGIGTTFCIRLPL